MQGVGSVVKASVRLPPRGSDAVGGASEAATVRVIVWRHPRPIGAAGRCIGRTDLPVDRRKLRRLAHRIRAAARRHGWPRVVWTSPLGRAVHVGRQLSAWGFEHRVDPLLAELDFGTWDGQPWDTIGAAALQAWCDRFEPFRPGDGESLAELLDRCGAFLAARQGDLGPVLVVGHAGWMQAAAHVCAGRPRALQAADWAQAPRHGESRVLAWALGAEGLGSPAAGGDRQEPGR